MNEVFDIRSIRDHLIDSLGYIGDIAKLFNDKLSQYNDYEEPFLLSITSIADILKIDIVQAIKSKIKLNERKYPLDLCYGNIKKYTHYSDETKISYDSGQSIVELTNDEIRTNEGCNNLIRYHDKYAELLLASLKFTIARGWDSKDTPRNLILAVFVELSELSQLFQWKSEDKLCLSRIEWDRAAQEIADVLIYTMKLSNSVSPINVEELERFVNANRERTM